jgi:acetylglutamate kinase
LFFFVCFAVENIFEGKVMTKKKMLAIKIGGEPANNEAVLSELASELKGFSQVYGAVLVHGGGDEVSSLTRKLGIEPRFVDGVRMTTGEEMKFVDMVLCGQVNKRIVRLFQKAGLAAVGLSGSDGRLFIGKSIGNKENHSHTGKITSVNPGILDTLLGGDYFPVIAPTSMDDDSVALNINADSVAFEIASAIKADALLFFSDIPGIMKNGKTLERLRSVEVLAEIDNGTITGGMIPKVKASIDALAKGVGKIIIGEYKGKGSLASLLDGSTGTQII